MEKEFCKSHCLMEEHIKEAPAIRSMVHRHDANIESIKSDMAEIKKTVGILPYKLFGVNLATIVALLTAMKGLGL
jgi:hypothetical protein